MTNLDNVTAGRAVFTGADGNRLVASRTEPAIGPGSGSGGGTPVLLLHGGGQTRRAWDRTAETLAAAGFLTLAADQRGHGESDWVEDGHYRFFDFARDAAALARAIESETGRKPIAVGASLGGIASLMAEFDTGQTAFSSLVLVDITPRMDPRGVSKITGFMRRKHA